jgi:hypothetical protein
MGAQRGHKRLLGSLSVSCRRACHGQAVLIGTAVRNRRAKFTSERQDRQKGAGYKPCPGSHLRWIQQSVELHACLRRHHGSQVAAFERTFLSPMLALDACRVARVRRRHTKQTTTGTRTNTTATEVPTPASTPALMPLLPDSGAVGGVGVDTTGGVGADISSGIGAGTTGSVKPELNGCCEGSTICALRGGMPVAAACSCKGHVVSAVDKSLLRR